MAQNHDISTTIKPHTVLRSIRLGYRITKNRLFVRPYTKPLKKSKKPCHALLRAIECTAGVYGIKLTTAKQLWATLEGTLFLNGSLLSDDENGNDTISNGELRQVQPLMKHALSTRDLGSEHRQRDETGAKEDISNLYEAFDAEWVESLEIQDHQETMQRLEACEVEILELLNDKGGLSIYLPVWQERGSAPSRDTEKPYQGGDSDTLWNGGTNTRVPEGLVRRAGTGKDGGGEKGIGSGGGDRDGRGQDNGEASLNTTHQNGPNMAGSPESLMFDAEGDFDPLQSRIFRLRREVLGQNHPETLAALAALAQTMKFFDQRHKAKVMEQEIARWRDEFLSQSSSLSSQATDALLSRRSSALQDRSEEARTMEILELRKEILGSVNPDILKAAVNFSQNLHQQGYFDKLESLLPPYFQERGLSLQERDIDVLLAFIRSQSCDEIDSAYILNIEYKKLRLIRDDGPPLFDVVWYMQDLVNRWHANGQYDKAHAMEIEIHELKLRILDGRGPQRMSYLEELADKCYKNRQYQQAEGFFVELLELKQKILGRKDPDTLKTMQNLADMWKQRQLEEDELIDRQLLEEPQEKQSIDVIISMHEQASALCLEAYDLSGSFDKYDRLGSAPAIHHETVEDSKKNEMFRNAELKHQEMIEEIKAVFGSGLTSVEMKVKELSRLWLECKAGKFEHLHEMREIISGLRNVEPGVPDTNKLAAVYTQVQAYLLTGSFEKAKSLMLLVLEAQKSALVAKDPGTVYDMQSLISRFTQVGARQQAKALENHIMDLMGHESGPEQGAPIIVDAIADLESEEELGLSSSSEEDRNGSDEPEDEWEDTDDEDEEPANQWAAFGRNMEDEDDLFINPWC